MKYQTKYEPYYHGGQPGRDKPQDQDKGYNKDKDYEGKPYDNEEKGYEPPPPPPPPPPPCPDPCDERPPWGPPNIRPECCPDNRACCPEGDQYCTWDEVDDPCVRAASCVSPWTKVECKCESSNAECGCEEWDCSCYPQGTCVPCYPCEGLLPNGPDDGDEPEGEGCADDLRRQLNDLRKAITSQQNQKADIQARIDAATEREGELKTLVEKFNEFIEGYEKERQKLICREDCLKGFHRDTSHIFEDSHRFPYECLEDFRNAINLELCKLEQEKCCQKSLEGKLEKFTRLIWEQQQAEKTLARVQAGFNSITTFPTWVGDQFKPLETLMDEINQALKDSNPLKQRWAFYLFYWKFVPGLCKRFPVAFCCPDSGYEHGGHEQQEGYKKHPPSEGPVNIGCEHGDWHPSVVTVEKLTKLICCAAEHVRTAKDNVQAKKNAVDKTKANLEFIKKKVEDDEKVLEDLIKSQLNKVECKPPASYR